MLVSAGIRRPMRNAVLLTSAYPPIRRTSCAGDRVLAGGADGGDDDGREDADDDDKELEEGETLFLTRPGMGLVSWLIVRFPFPSGGGERECGRSLGTGRISNVARCYSVQVLPDCTARV
jgi:hypothetical protein